MLLEALRPADIIKPTRIAELRGRQWVPGQCQKFSNFWDSTNNGYSLQITAISRTNNGCGLPQKVLSTYYFVVNPQKTIRHPKTVSGSRDGFGRQQRPIASAICRKVLKGDPHYSLLWSTTARRPILQRNSTKQEEGEIYKLTVPLSAEDTLA